MMALYGEFDINNEVQIKANIYEFAQVFLSKLSIFLDQNDETLDNYNKKNVVKLAYHFNISIEDFVGSLRSKCQNQFELKFHGLQSDLFRDYKKNIQGNIAESKKFDELLNFTVNNKISRQKSNASQKPKALPKSDLNDQPFPRVESEYYLDNQQYLQDIWIIVKSKFNQSEKIKKIVKEERRTLSQSIVNIEQMFEFQENSENKDFLINQDDLLLKIFNYIEFWKQKNANLQHVIYALRILRDMIKDLEGKELVLIQNNFDKLNAIKIILILIWEENEANSEYLYYLLKLAISLVADGNQQVQKTIFEFFITNSQSENLFRKIKELFIDMKSNFTPATRNKLILQQLKLLQLFCEGHNQELQNYIRDQTNSKTNYDMVNLTVLLLLSFEISDENFDTVVQCFKTLTEFVQGPCKQNQKAIVDSKFLEYAVQILSEDEKIFDNNREKQLKKNTKDFLESNSKKANLLPKLHQNLNTNLVIHRGNLARLKFHCLTTINSLLECNNPNDPIQIHIKRSIPFHVLRNNLTRIYYLYQKYHDEYKEELFNIQETQEKIDLSKDEEQQEFILENGFFIFILIYTFVDNSQNLERDENDEDFDEFIQYFSQKQQQQPKFFKRIVVGQLFNFFQDLIKVVQNFFHSLSNLGKSGQSKKVSQPKHQEIHKKNLEKLAIDFFKQNIAHVEIVRDDQIYKIFFPILPQCKMLPKDLKKSFIENVDWEGSKKKQLSTLIIESAKLNLAMTHEENLRIFFNKNKFIGLLASHGPLWKQLAFLTNLVLNFLIIVSYSSQFIPENQKNSISVRNFYRRNDPHFFHLKDGQKTRNAIIAIGIVNIIFSSLVVFFFLVKKAPLLIKHIWNNFLDQKSGIMHKLLNLLIRVIYSLIICLTDFEFSYYCAYILFAILGLAVHPFLFCFHLADFFKNPVLRNVIKSVWIPKVAIMLTLLVFVIIEWYFTIFSYMYFNDHYQQGFCDHLWVCFLTTFDWTFKETGAVGVYLKYSVQNKTSDVNDDYSGIDHSHLSLYIRRFFFDNIFNIVLVIIVINLLAGIIIDTFKSLTYQMQQRDTKIKQYCFICGMERDFLDKCSQGGYFQHIKQDHNMWNYVYFQAYLDHTKVTEFNGNESYVYNKIKSQYDPSWFPLKRALAIKLEDEEDNFNIDKFNQISDNMKDLQFEVDELVIKEQSLISKIEKK